MARTFTKYEQPRRIEQGGLTSIYCRQCGREIMRAIKPQIRTVTKCAIGVCKEQGMENPEDHVLAQYYLSNDPNKLPTPIDFDASSEGGMLLLYPNTEKVDSHGNPMQSGGLFGTVKSLFRVLGFAKSEEPEPASREVSVRKRKGGGLFDDRIR